MLILALLSFALLMPSLQFRDASASTQVSAIVVAHKNTASLNGGQVGNTTNLYSSSTQTIQQSVTQSSQFSTSWDLDPCLASSITIVSATVFNVYLQANTSLSGVTLGAQLNEIASCGTGSETTLFGGEQTTTISMTTSKTGYQVSIPFGSNTVIPAGYSLHFIVYVNPNTAHAQTITLSYDSASAPATFTLGIDNPVTVNPVTVSPMQIASPQTATGTLSISDAFGLYDLASVTYSASTEGVVAQTGSMTASSSNQPAGLTGSFSGTVDPTNSQYSDYAGVWSVDASATDQSGNTYTSSPTTFVYSSSGGTCPGSGCPGSGDSATTSTTSSGENGSLASWFNPQETADLIIIAVVVFLILLSTYLLVVRRR